MGILPCLPTVKRCCFCTKKLKVACVFIDIWSMFVSSHEIGILCWPVCYNLYDNQSLDPMHLPLSVLRWILLTINLLVLVSSFAYLIGIFWSFPLTAIFFVLCGLLSAGFSMAFSIYYALEMSLIKCANPSDVIAFNVYAVLWCYFVIVVNSYDME